MNDNSNNITGDVNTDAPLSKEDFKRYMDKSGTSLILQKALASLYLEYNRTNGDCDPLTFLAAYLKKQKNDPSDSTNNWK